MPTPDQVHAAVQTYVDTFQKGDREGWLANFAPDAVQYDPATAPPNVGREAIGVFWDNTHSLTERIEFDVEEIIVAGDEAVLVFTMRAYGSGLAITFRIVDVFTVDDSGRISRIKAYFDPSRMRTIDE